ncbi:unnamed protein product [Owenia fusiformis]|uniref:Deoxyribonuclease n=1 Tax=Owenia fusiformis TaxID=6347 RepID=A0A8J1Y7C7_OWEFU|nr:unnamed protein product [Owenia fusiformis]
MNFLAFFLLGAIAIYTACGLRIGAWNIQTFGVTKMGRPEVVRALVQVILRYDVLLIQEIRDASFTAIFQLLDEVNRNDPTGDEWAMELSDRLGRSTSKEQYAYFYRVSLVSIDGDDQYPESRDEFERPPYTVRLRTSTSAGTFSFGGIHVKPGDAVAEIDGLADVYDHVVGVTGDSNVLLGGDFNAGCSYVRPGDWEFIRLRTQSRFTWLIGDDADTNVAQGSQCAYDRLVVSGSRLLGAVRSANVYRFDDALGLSNSEAMAVSDHYPVEMEIV